MYCVVFIIFLIIGLDYFNGKTEYNQELNLCILSSYLWQLTGALMVLPACEDSTTIILPGNIQMLQSNSLPGKDLYNIYLPGNLQMLKSNSIRGKDLYNIYLPGNIQMLQSNNLPGKDLYNIYLPGNIQMLQSNSLPGKDPSNSKR